MPIKINAAVISNKGLWKTHNEDNFIFDRKILEDVNNEVSLKTRATCNIAVMGVFDGMGGEPGNETAASIAAKTFRDIDNLTFEGIDKNIYFANDKICEYMSEHKTSRMGTTMALLYVNEKNVVTVNIGDSRIYKYESGKLVQLSHDHSTIRADNQKVELTQYLGIYPKEMKIEPYGIIGKTRKCRYLVCSNGLTDMVEDSEIKKIMKGKIGDIPTNLMKKALENGGKDSVTILVVEVSTDKGFFARLFGK